jgi:hypothetical protein
MLDNVNIETNFGNSDVGIKLKMVARLMHMNKTRSVNRDVFLIQNVSYAAFVEMNDISQTESQG